ncbi:uncharacterized protein J3D65DRAFT_598741 [Phyllosticta citribraziliensis]|uniref:Uncharacterized protein n=1 Tax=Phyllosticta citribraziliensis TaxID=989973 RepID=A0ABR1M868_9PEZI
MRFQSILAAGASLLGLSAARLVGVKVPSTIAPGDLINVKLVSENYIQSVYDVSVAFGLAPDASYGFALGSVAGAQFLGPGNSNKLEDIQVLISLPNDAPTGQQIFGAAVTSLYGASSSPVISSFNVTVTVGDKTSDDYVQSEGFQSFSPY